VREQDADDGRLTTHDPASATPPAGTDTGLDALGALADPVRRSLYRFVVARADPVSKDEAAAHAGISRSLAAYHLDRLAHDGLLAVTFARLGGRSGPGAGRPAKLYAPTRTEISVQLPPRDDTLLARLLAVAVEADDSGATRAALFDGARAEGERAAADYRRTEAPGTDAPGTEAAMAALLVQRGYSPRATEDEIRMRNCPFHHLVADHRDLVCGLNFALLDAVARALGPPDTEYCAVLEPSPEHCCVVLRRAESVDRPD
jgi:predicted ArsR family transcriptional regulator